MWVVFLLSALGFAIGALILFSIGWLILHKIEMHINRQDDDYENEKENRIKEGMQHGSVYAVYIMHAIHDSLCRQWQKKVGKSK